MNDNDLLYKFKPGDRVVYSPLDPVRTPQVLEYSAMVQSRGKLDPRGVRYKIEYVRDGRKVRSWVRAKNLRSKP